MAEARQAAQLPHLPPQAGGQWEHSPAPCPISPPAPSLAGVPMPEPPSHHTVHPPSPNGVWHCTEETSAHGAALPQALAPLAPKVLSLGSMCVQHLRAPSHPHTPQPQPASGSSHSLGTAPHMPLNPARLQAGGMCTSKQLLLQPYLLLLSARGRSTPGPGRALRAQGALLSPRRSLGGVSPQQGEAAMSRLGDGHHQPWREVTGASPVPHTGLFLTSLPPNIPFWKLKANFSLYFGRKREKKKNKATG